MNQRAHWLAFSLVALLLVACGDGLLRLAEIRGSGFTSGSAQSFGSIVINDVRYDTDGASTIINGSSGNEAELIVGQRLLVRGFDNGDGTGSASRVEFSADVIGAVDSIDRAQSRFTVLGQRVQVDGVTVLDDAQLAGLGVGDVVSVSGSRGLDGVLRAEAVQRLASAPAGSQVQVQGQVENLNRSAQTLAIGGLAIDYASAATVSLPALNNGALVVVRGTETSSGMRADSVQLAPAGSGVAGDVVRLRGLIQQRQSDGAFVVVGQLVRLVAGSALSGGNSDDLIAGVDVAVIGLLAADGSVEASSVEIINAQERTLPVSIVATVESVSADNVQVLGLDVRRRARTLVRDARDDQRPFGLTDLQVGDTVALRCFGDNGTIVANLIERVEAQASVTVTAPLLGLDEAAQRINVDGVITDTTAAAFEDSAGAPLTSSAFYAQAAAGDFVDVTGSFDGTLLTATRVVLRD